MQPHFLTFRLLKPLCHSKPNCALNMQKTRTEAVGCFPRGKLIFCGDETLADEPPLTGSSATHKGSSEPPENEPRGKFPTASVRHLVDNPLKFQSITQSAAPSLPLITKRINLVRKLSHLLIRHPITLLHQCKQPGSCSQQPRINTAKLYRLRLLHRHRLRLIQELA